MHLVWERILLVFFSSRINQHVSWMLHLVLLASLSGSIELHCFRESSILDVVFLRPHHKCTNVHDISFCHRPLFCDLQSCVWCTRSYRRDVLWSFVLDSLG